MNKSAISLDHQGENKKQQSTTYCFLATSIDVGATATWQSYLHPCKRQLRKRKTAKTLLVNIWKNNQPLGEGEMEKEQKTSQHLWTTRDKKVAKTETIYIHATSQGLQCPGLKQKTKTKTTTNLLDCSSQLEKENEQQNNCSSEQNFWSSMMLMTFFQVFVPYLVQYQYQVN